MEPFVFEKIKDLEDESSRLKKMFAELSIKCHTLKNVNEKNFKTSDKA